MELTFDDFEAKYADLAVVTCEWRAIDVADPEVMAAEVFRQLRTKAAPPTLRQFYKIVESVIDSAFRQAVASQSLIDGLMRGAFAMGGRPKADLESRIRQALVSLPMRDVELLRQSCWDLLTPQEMSEVNGRDAATQSARLAVALQHFGAKLPVSVKADPAAAMRSIQPGTHRRGQVDPDAPH